jgi:branched-chain amino acid aminotransferase
MYYKDDTIVYLNGEWIKSKDASTSLYAQTMHYGSGVFEGIRSYNTVDGTRIFKAKEHFGYLQLMRQQTRKYFQVLFVCTK